MQYKQLPVGVLQANCYILWDSSNNGLVVDPGGDGGSINRFLSEHKIKPLAILLTHAHFDHIGGIEDVIKEWDIPIYIHHLESDWLVDPNLNGSARFPVEKISVSPADVIVIEQAKLTVGPFTIQIYETPGHSPGSISFYFDKEGIIFSGDVLFAGSIGRTDLPGGNQEQLLTSIHEKLLTLPEETIVAPGHGNKTTIQLEMDSNPFLSGF